MPTALPLSILMLTYNREDYLPRAIESVLTQTFTDFEYLIVDNGSTDKSDEIIESYARRDSRIKVLHIEKSSVGRGRNIALDNSIGEYLTFIDDDDYAEPDMLEFLYGLAMGHQADISVCGSMKEVSGAIIPNCVFEDCLVLDRYQAVVELLRRKKLNAATATKLFRRSLFKTVRFTEASRVEDISTTYKLFAEAGKVVACGRPKYCFCRHEQNLTAFTDCDKLLNPRQLEEYFAAFRERTEYLSVKLPELADYAQYSEWSYMISMCNKIISNNLGNCRKQLNFARDTLRNNYAAFRNSPFIETFEKAYLDKYIPHP